MAGYRPIYKRIWKDPDFQELCAEDKLIFLYLCTNEAVTESGIYPITPKTIANETGIDVSTVQERLHNGFFKNIIFDQENKFVFIKKLKKYGTGGRPDLVNKSIANEYHCYSTTSLWNDFLVEYPEFNGLLNGSITNGQPADTLRYSTDNDNDISTLIEENRELKKFPAEHVFLRKEVFAGLKQRLGYNVRSPAAEAKAISQMLSEGLSPDDILKAYDLIKAQPFFGDKYLSMMHVRKDIHEVLKNGANTRNARKVSKQYSSPDDYRRRRQ